jgi:hypothetical protein
MGLRPFRENRQAARPESPAPVSERGSSGSDSSGSHSSDSRSTGRELGSLLWLGVPAVVATCIYVADPGAIGGTALLTAAASFAVGALLGFLFGIPRSLTGDRGNAQEDSALQRPRVEPNTNLEQISDWLTKILVGVSLVQFKEIGEAIGDAAETLAPTFGGREATGEAVVVAIIAAFAITGFLSGFLFTRLRLQGAFALADLLEAVEEKTDAAIEAVEEKTDLDANALATVRSQLDPGDGPTEEELTAALREASPGVRAQAFYLARDQRRTNWRPDGDRKLLELTIPVFKALIASDEKNRYHRNKAELGFALKDKEPPDYEAARKCLDDAIAIRGTKASGQYALYEFNRAVCRIHLDPAFAKGEPTPAPDVDEIVSDFEVAVTSQLGCGAMRDDAAARGWLAVNAANPRVAAVKGRAGV